MRKINPDYHKKLEVIEGDCMELNLGMKAEDVEKMKNVSVIFHSAACVRFDDPLKNAILLNTRATKEVCEFATKLKNLEVLIHVSTAYCNPKRNFMEETVSFLIK